MPSESRQGVAHRPGLHGDSSKGWRSESMNRVVFLAIILLAFAGAPAIFAETKPAPNQASNEQVALAGAVMLDRVEIRDALGTDLWPGYAVVRITVTPKTDEALRVSPDDFTLLSRKDGDRGGALQPSQIAG